MPVGSHVGRLWGSPRGWGVLGVCVVGYLCGVALGVALCLYRWGSWVGGWVGLFVGDLISSHKDLAHPFSAGLPCVGAGRVA